jgi:hypothetical protein
VERRENAAAVLNLAIDLASGNEKRTGYKDHYTEDRELKVWSNYATAFTSSAPSEPVFRAHYVRDRIREFVPKGTTVLNFGCSYGWLEGQLTEYNMVGIDRSEAAMDRNREIFQGQFVAGDVFEYMASNPIDVLCHINVGTYFLPRFLSRLYATEKQACDTSSHLSLPGAAVRLENTSITP